MKEALKFLNKPLTIRWYLVNSPITTSSNPKSRRDLWLIVQGRCLFPTKTNENHGASKSSVGSRKQLISSCLDLVIADF